MNKIRNQTGGFIISVGEEDSHIRNKEVYYITIKKLINHINNNWLQGGLNRHTPYIELEYICEDDNIPKDKINGLINSANYYSILNEDGGIK